MSHFTVLITKTQNASIDAQLVPFDEDLEVEEYDRDCWCIGNIAALAARDRARKDLNFDIEEVRKHYWALPEGLRTDEKWQLLTAEVDALTKKYEQAHSLYEKPDPDCEECHGNGKYKSTYNPDAQWDWYVVGGRWMGALALKPGAVGELGEPGVFRNDAEDGTADIAKVKDVDWGKTGTMYAILHNGEWIERGQMGWFGMSSNEKSKEEWDKQFADVIAQLDPEDEVTVVDCHI